MTATADGGSVAPRMRAPTESESIVLRVALAGGLVVAVSALVGWIVGPLVGVVVFVIATLVPTAVVAVLYLSTVSRDRPLIARRAGERRHARGAAGGKRRVVVFGKHAHRHRAA